MSQLAKKYENLLKKFMFLRYFAYNFKLIDYKFIQYGTKITKKN